jgi:uncharacterized protein (TIGR03083 family)
VTLAVDCYLQMIRRDGDLLADAAAGRLDAPIPSCPEWVMADLIAHIGVVHRHKEHIVRKGLTENPGVDEAMYPPEDEADLVPWYAEGLDLLLDTLESADPDTPVWTFHAPEQTVSFWHRRMAHETAVHRVDAQLGAGTEPTKMGPDLAVDGLDEVLGPVFSAYGPGDEFTADGRVVALETSVVHAVRRLRLGDGEHGPGWQYGPGENGTESAKIMAPACDLYLWVWGRLPDDVITVAGDTALAALVREGVARVT